MIEVLEPDMISAVFVRELAEEIWKQVSKNGWNSVRFRECVPFGEKTRKELAGCFDRPGAPETYEGMLRIQHWSSARLTRVNSSRRAPTRITTANITVLSCTQIAANISFQKILMTHLSLLSLSTDAWINYSI
jgi:hypothetical protein